ncbi:hypothetical protein [Roseibium sp.]|uniref:hypothetical protein n=1 Tax=Roseibium sp. TaxID=1936156 RepID=UPI003BAE5C53
MTERTRQVKERFSLKDGFGEIAQERVWKGLLLLPVRHVSAALDFEQKIDAKKQNHRDER